MKRRVFVLSILMIAVALLLLFAACNAGKTPTKIIITNAPTTTKVVQGQEPNLSGGLVEVEFEDGSVKEIEMSKLSYVGLNRDLLGTQTIALIYRSNGKTVSTAIDLTVVAPKVTSLDLSTEGVKLSYVEGESFDRTNLVVTATDQTGKVLEATGYEITPRVLTVETTVVTLTFRGASAEIPVTVVPCAPASVEIKQQPAVTSYYVGEPFSPEGLVLFVTHNNGSTETFNSDQLKYYHTVGFLQSYLGAMNASDNVVRVVANTKYGEASTNLTLQVTEVAPTLLTVKMQNELIFEEGDYFSFMEETESVLITIKYNYGDDETVVASFDHFTYNHESLVKEQSFVTVWQEGYPEVTANIPVTVTPPIVETIWIMALPTVTEYAVGDRVNLAGLQLQIKTVNNHYFFLDYDEDSGIVPISDIIVADQSTVTVSYGGSTASFDITMR